jgi:hypothetical protein
MHEKRSGNATEKRAGRRENGKAADDGKRRLEARFAREPGFQSILSVQQRAQVNE